MCVNLVLLCEIWLLCPISVPLEQSSKTTYFIINFLSVAKPLHLLGEWFGYYADYVTKPGRPAALNLRLCNVSHSSCERFCYHGFKEVTPSVESCISSCVCNETVAEIGEFGDAVSVVRPLIVVGLPLLCVFICIELNCLINVHVAICSLNQELEIGASCANDKIGGEVLGNS